MRVLLVVWLGLLAAVPSGTRAQNLESVCHSDTRNMYGNSAVTAEMLRDNTFTSVQSCKAGDILQYYVRQPSPPNVYSPQAAASLFCDFSKSIVVDREILTCVFVGLRLSR